MSAASGKKKEKLLNREQIVQLLRVNIDLTVSQLRLKQKPHFLLEKCKLKTDEVKQPRLTVGLKQQQLGSSSGSLWSSVPTRMTPPSSGQILSAAVGVGIMWVGLS